VLALDAGVEPFATVALTCAGVAAELLRRRDSCDDGNLNGTLALEAVAARVAARGVYLFLCRLIASLGTRATTTPTSSTILIIRGALYSSVCVSSPVT